MYRRCGVLLASLIVGCNGSTPAPGDLGRDGDGWTDSRRDVHRDGPAPVTPTWIPLKAATFYMGSPLEEPCRTANETRHQVTLTHGFEIQSTEVTQGQFVAAMAYEPFSSCGPGCPVMDVTWHEAAAYANALSTKAGLTPCYACSGAQSAVICSVAATFATPGKIYGCPGYRLPTEAEWEYAYRASTTTAFYNGPIAAGGCASGSDTNADAIGWYSSNSSADMHPVGLKLANAWGLHDMAGNGIEWVHDLHAEDLGSAAVVDPTGAQQDACRVLRGGSWQEGALKMRAAFRASDQPDKAYADYGFRVARTK